MTFQSLVTQRGHNRLAEAVALRQSLNLTKFAVGDGNGTNYQPSDNQTALVNELHSAAINAIYQHETNANWLVIEGVIPATVGGWYVRELGIFDDADNLIVIANLPETYKPILAEGTGKDIYVRVIMEHGNVSSVELLIDPDVVLASRTFVSTEITAALAAQLLTGHGDVSITGLQDGHILVRQGNEWVNQDGAKEVERLRKKVMLNTLMHSMSDAAAIAAMDAHADGFSDDSNIDAAASSGWSYDAANDLIDSARDWTGDNSSMTAGRFGAHTQWDSAGFFMSATFGGGYQDSFWDPDDSFAGEFDWEFTYVSSNGGGGPTSLFFCLHDDTSIAGLTGSSYDFGTFAIALPGGGTTAAIQENGVATGDNVPCAAGDVIRISRNADNRFEVRTNGVLHHTSANSFAGALRPVCTLSHNSTASTARSCRVNDISVTEPGDMTLVSIALEASIEPADGYLLAIIDGNPVLDTDLMAALSKDDGTTWDAVPLTNVGTTEDGQGIVYGEATFTPSGDQTIRWKLETQNQKAISVHGVVMDAAL